jgi:UDP-N-acetylglucosamine acyltransferase
MTLGADMSAIHPTAVVDPGAELAADVQVGPHAVIGPHVRIGPGTRIGAHCVIEGHTTLGPDNQVFQFASLGAAPQDKKYRGEPTRLEIGAGNTFREFVTVNTGTVQDGGLTQVGDDNWIMAYVHIAHDCRVGSHTIIANATQLGGHVHLGDWAFLGGLSGVHQFVRVGAHAMTGFQTRLSQDLPPFVTAAGNPAEATGINAEGLRRRGFSAERIALVKRLHRVLYRQGLTLAAAQAAIEAMKGSVPGGDDDIALLLAFLAGAERGIVR